jgi:hypothetical protein
VGAQTVSIAASHTAFRYRPSAAYDVDPVLGSTTMPGFTELAGIYNSYRVTKSKFRFEIVSNDARTGSVVLIPLNTDPTGAPGATTVESWPMNPYRVYKMIPPTGARPVILEKTMSTEKIFGSKAVYFDDNFMSLTNTIPNNNWFWAVGIHSPVPIATTAWSCTSLIVITIHVEFFNRKELLS